MILRCSRAIFWKSLMPKPSGAIKGISPEALNCFTQYDWPGNVRELENLIERLVILKEEGIIEREDLPEKSLEAPRAVVPLLHLKFPMEAYP